MENLEKEIKEIQITMKWLNDMKVNTSMLDIYDIKAITEDIKKSIEFHVNWKNDKAKEIEIT